MELDGRTILITGSNRGIGHALLSRLAREPVQLLAGVRAVERYAAPEIESAACRARVKPVELDLSGPASIDAACERLGRVDVLINNAGVFTGGTIDQLEVAAIYETVQVNLAGLIHLTRRVLPGMLRRGEGKIVNQASIISDLEYPGTAVYAATKAGVSAFTHSLRRELAETSLSTLEVVTGGYDTDMLQQAAEQLEHHSDPSRWEWRDPHEWTDRIVEAIGSDDETLEPGGKSQFGRVAARAPHQLLDAVAKRTFKR